LTARNARELVRIRREKARELWDMLDAFEGRVTMTELEYSNPGLLYDMLDGKRRSDEDKYRQASASLNKENN
jgi:hypothetical protein